MIPEFKNLPQLLDYFKEESVCLAHWEQVRWGGAVKCPHCGHDRVYRTTRGFKCANAVCHKKFSALVGSIFENTKIPLRIWFAAIYLCTAHKKGISSLQLGRDLGISQKTAWYLLHRIRALMAVGAPEMLEGTVEVDETYVGGKNKNRHKSKKVEGSQGRSAKDKTPVVGLLERGGKVVTVVVADTESGTLHPIVKANVKTKATLVTDAYRSYRGLEKEYRHVVVKHEDGGYVVDNKFHTQNIENFWSILKRGIIGIYHYISPKHLHRYCEEFGYRYNNRQISDAQRFCVTLGNGGSVQMLYKVLTAKNVTAV